MAGNGGAEKRRDEIEDQLEIWNVPDDQRDKYLAEPEDEEPFALFPSNWDAFMLFLGTSTQWRTTGMGGTHTGLDYVAMEVVARAMEITIDKRIFWRIKVIEGVAVAGINKIIRDAQK